MTAALTDLATDTLVVVGALFPIVNPIGNTPIFLSLTRGLSERGRSALARMVALNSLTLILASIFIGTHILAFFGISLPVVQVGGGLIITATGWALLRQPNDDRREQDGPPKCNDFALPRHSFYPLTLDPGTNYHVSNYVAGNLIIQLPHSTSLGRNIYMRLCSEKMTSIGSDAEFN